ncbi:hypothetical protein [Treponema sp.]|uniref:hypothetical protein n=1 Tax=Treponema sp. TaxID=166 RepID=UPI003890760D
MKRLLFAFLAVLSLTACELIVDEFDSSESTQSNTQEETLIAVPSVESALTVVPSVANQVFKIDANTAGISISTNENLAGKSIYYAVVNTSSTKVEKEYARYVTEKTNSDRSVVEETYEPEFDDDDEDIHNAPLHDYFFPEFETSSSRSVSSKAVAPVEKLTLKEGTTKKTLYVRGRSDYTLKTATLYAFNDICNIWILDGDAFITGEKRKFELSESYAKKFAEIYPLIRTVFGEESDSIYTSTRGARESMNKISETGTKVNIVLYDIGADASQGNTIGLFSSMDYYKNGLTFSNTKVNRSNEGKYFYIDSYFAVTRYDYSLSTLAHEFQHMINFSVKAMNGLSCDSNLNEMLSMLCEDMMQSYLGISDEYSPRNRIKTFIKKYYLTGIRNYDASVVAYANAYIFGVWLTREFGGAPLVKEMMSNKASNNDCIAKAVNTLSGKNMSFDEIFSQFVNAVFHPEESAFVRDADESLSCGSYTYPMKGLSRFESPVIFENFAVSSIPASYGIIFKKYAEISGSETSVKLNFATESGKTNSNVLVYVCIK